MSAVHATQRAAMSASVSAPHDDSPGQFDAEVRPGQDHGREPKGRIMLGCAAASTSDRPRINAASPHYLRAPEPRAATPHAAVLLAGRSTSQGWARVEHAGTVGVEAMLSTHDPGAVRVAHRDDGLGAPTNTAYEDCLRLDHNRPTAQE